MPQHGRDVPRNIPFGRPLVSADERALVAQALEGTQLTQGPLARRFEAEFAELTGAPHALATSSCMGALHLACMSMALAPGDEVIVSAQTHVATAMAVELCGGRCVFVDSEPETGNIDLALVEQRITPRTRGIAVVHFLGMPVDMERLRAIARPRGLFVVEDCALALGATCRGRHVGLWGDAGAFSFYPVKHIATGEGGMLVTTRDDVARLAGLQRAFGVERSTTDGRPGDEYDAVAIGLNYRMSELAAALGVGQLGHLPEFLAARHANHRALSAMLGAMDGISLLRSSHDGLESAHYCMCVLLDDRLASHRAEIVSFVRARGIGVSIYYPRPVPEMRVFSERYGGRAADFPVASHISRCSFALPVGPHVTADDVEYIGNAVSEAIASVRLRGVTAGSGPAGPAMGRVGSERERAVTPADAR